MKIIFMGTPEFARACLQGLTDAGHEVMCVVTQPDRPAGRGKKPRMSAVKVCAMELGLEVLQPERVNCADFTQVLKKFDADIFVVAAYGQILSQKLLDMPKYGAINVHASLLPLYRGAAPIQKAILDGQTKTGITIMQMDKGMDTGDMLLKKEVEISASDTGGTLHDKLCSIACEPLLQVLEQIKNGTCNPQKQDHEKATYAPMITKDMAKINFDQNAHDIVNMVRAYNPHPGATTQVNDKILKIWNAQVSSTAPKLCPKDGILMATKSNTLHVLEVTPPNGKRMTAADYVKGLATVHN